MSYQPKPLPFNNELNGISPKTMEIHHDKLYVGYVNKRNEIEQKLETVSKEGVNGTYHEYGELKRSEIFAANAVVLHEYYFDILGGNGEAQGGELVEALTKQFGSLENWVNDMKAAGMTARGWVVLAYDFNTKKLHSL